MEITLRPRTAHSPWNNGKIETQNQHIAQYWKNFLTDLRNNRSSLAPMFVVAHNTSVNYTTGTTPYEKVFRTNPQIPVSLKHGLYRIEQKLCGSEFCKEFSSHSHSENNLKNQLLDILLRPQLSHGLLERERDFKNSKESVLLLSKDVATKQLDRTPTEIDSNWDNAWTKAKKFFREIVAKIFSRVKNFNRDDSDLLR